jgi:hypothetical protein
MKKERIRKAMEDIGMGKSSKEQKTKANTEKLDYIKLKSFCPEKEIICQRQDKLQNEKKFAKCTPDKGLFSRIY